MTTNTVRRDAKGRWLPGQRGNLDGLGGRPKGTLSLIELLKKQLSQHPEDAAAIVQGLVALGKNKDMRAIEQIFDRVDGKPTEHHIIEGQLPIKIVFVPAETLPVGGTINEALPAPKAKELESGQTPPNGRL